MATSHQELTDLHLRPALGVESAGLAILADMATRSLSSHVRGLAAKVGQSPLGVGRTFICYFLDSLLHYRHWQVPERSEEVVEAIKEHILKHPPSVLLQPEAVFTVQPLNALKSRAKKSWYISAISMLVKARGRQLGHSLLRISERLVVVASAEEITLVVCSFIGTARKLYEQMAFLEQARQELPFQNRIKAVIGFSWPKNCAW
jgi:hypothetical protein